jgi:hypothetical protein
LAAVATAAVVDAAATVATAVAAAATAARVVARAAAETLPDGQTEPAVRRDRLISMPGFRSIPSIVRNPGYVSVVRANAIQEPHA